jgi:DNA (cytosine-5)-methyltransferase 1
MTRETEALVMPMEGRGPVSSIKPVSEPFRTATGRHQDALVMPYYGRSGAVPAELPLGTMMTRDHHALIERGEDSMLAPLRNNGNCELTSQPMRTFAAGGYHHALVMRNNTARGDQGQMSTPVTEPLRTLLGEGRQSLIQPGDGSALLAYDTGLLRPLGEPLPTQTTVEGDALVSTGGRRFVDVDSLYLRMLAIEEIQEGMAFRPEYVLLGKAKRNKVKMLGNAVTPNAARDLAAMVMEAVTGVDIPLFETDKLLLP